MGTKGSRPPLFGVGDTLSESTKSEVELSQVPAPLLIISNIIQHFFQTYFSPRRVYKNAVDFTRSSCCLKNLLCC